MAEKGQKPFHNEGRVALCSDSLTMKHKLMAHVDKEIKVRRIKTNAELRNSKSLVAIGTAGAGR